MRAAVFGVSCRRFSLDEVLQLLAAPYPSRMDSTHGLSRARLAPCRVQIIRVRRVPVGHCRLRTTQQIISLPTLLFADAGGDHRRCVGQVCRLDSVQRAMISELALLL